ncbi:carbon storage regulator [Halopseudomonas salegens]|uniref:Carbon storage regulator, CsrA n=1 Tax=Halopseudomonas salegens TaxID=1434072 RepID=A0A1H2EQH6_9GAMM|nr:carbon storage regulator [Halopseudomonas salegens]SDT97304.1 carbon storage regulator, CsrA [Halopseudomonas salegens]
MLILTRRTGEILRIGDDIKIQIVNANPRIVRIKVEAPHQTKAVREERQPREPGQASVTDKS